MASIKDCKRTVKASILHSKVKTVTSQDSITTCTGYLLKATSFHYFFTLEVLICYSHFKNCLMVNGQLDMDMQSSNEAGQT